MIHRLVRVSRAAVCPFADHIQLLDPPPPPPGPPLTLRAFSITSFPNAEKWPPSERQPGQRRSCSVLTGAAN